jgi:hypothetical protein
MDYAATQPAENSHDAVVIPLGGIDIPPTMVSVTRDTVVAMPFARSEIDNQTFSYDDEHRLD